MMADGAGENARSEARTSVSTTTTHGPFTTVTTSHTSGDPRTTVTTNAPHTTTVTHPTVTTSYQFNPPPVAPVASNIPPDRRPSIRIRRQGADRRLQAVDEDAVQAARRRSSSEPQRPPLALLTGQDDLDIRRQVSATPLQPLPEEGVPNSTLDVPRPRRPSMMRNISAISLRRRDQNAPEYTPQVVNMLDIIDPEVSTLTTLNNVQNSLFVPNLGWLYNRQPTYDLTQSTSESSDEEIGMAYGYPEHQARTDDKTEGDTGEEPGGLTRTNTITSVLSGLGEGHNYAVLPHGASLPGWTAEEKAALNDHVRHLLHSRRARFRRKMRGFGKYVRKPVGFLITLYAFLITFWGAAWVLFLIGWISVGDRQAYFIEICDQVLTALFCVVGIGMSPWRAVDTYHMTFVAFYAHRTWRLRRERGLPALRDRNELPAMSMTPAWERDEEPDQEHEETVLTAEEQKKLEHHQDKLAKSHTFYRPHETSTHHAFSVRLLIAVVTLLDCHSLFQMALGGTTWGIYYKDRPKALTAIILSCSISCNITAGILISIGDKRSRKKLVAEQMFRQSVTGDALKELKKERGLKAAGIESHKKKKKGKGKRKIPIEEKDEPIHQENGEIQQHNEK